jgi:hypothetical protein
MTVLPAIINHELTLMRDSVACLHKGYGVKSNPCHVAPSVNAVLKEIVALGHLFAGSSL